MFFKLTSRTPRLILRMAVCLGGALFAGSLSLSAQRPATPPAPSQAAISTPIMSLAEVQTGMKAVGRTVFTGNKIEEFQAEILGVLRNVSPRQSLIMARVSGGPLEQTGVLAGMSGSPVYINGRLIGAVAMTFQFIKDPIAGITPIEQMIESSQPIAAPPSKQKIAQLSAEEARATTPLKVPPAAGTSSRPH